jgi:hypothetical protein
VSVFPDTDGWMSSVLFLDAPSPLDTTRPGLLATLLSTFDIISDRLQTSSVRFEFVCTRWTKLVPVQVQVQGFFDSAWKGSNRRRGFSLKIKFA